MDLDQQMSILWFGFRDFVQSKGGRLGGVGTGEDERFHC